MVVLVCIASIAGGLLMHPTKVHHEPLSLEKTCVKSVCAIEGFGVVDSTATFQSKLANSRLYPT